MCQWQNARPSCLQNEHFDFNDEEFLNDLKQVFHFYNNGVVLEHKENKQKVSKQFDTLDDAIKNINDNNIRFGNLILYNFDIPALKQKFKERNL